MQGYHQQPQTARRMASQPQLHSGVQQFMAGVYAWMTAGLGVTAAVIFGLSFSPETVIAIALGPIKWVLFAGLMGIGWFVAPRLDSMDRVLAGGVFFVYSALMGAFISWVPLAYNLGSIASALGGTVGIFAVMAVLGYTTKKDLTGMGQFMVMALFGAVIGSIINVIFLQSSMMGFLIAVVVAVTSAGLTAYYNQAIKQVYLMHGGAGNLAIVGALMLYTNFINLFMSLLRIFGSSRD